MFSSGTCRTLILESPDGQCSPQSNRGAWRIRLCCELMNINALLTYGYNGCYEHTDMPFTPLRTHAGRRFNVGSGMTNADRSNPPALGSIVTCVANHVCPTRIIRVCVVNLSMVLSNLGGFLCDCSDPHV